MTRQQDPWLKQVIGQPERYRLEALLGQGGMGKVFKAIDLQDLGGSKPYRAIKIMSVDLTIASEAQRRFSREMRACLHIQDQRIVQALDFGVAPLALSGIPQELPYLVMELITAPTLHKVLRETPRLPLERALNLGQQIAQSLQVIHHGVTIHDHSVQLVHRDLKPANLFVVPHNNSELIKLADFGLVKLLGDLTQSKLTQTGSFAGSPAYASPEQCRGDRTIDGRTDQYSLGCILYQMLTGTNLFGISNRTNPLIWLQAHLEKAPQPFPASLDIPTAVEQIVMRCLQKTPRDRYGTIDDLIKELVDIRQQISPSDRVSSVGVSIQEPIQSLSQHLSQKGFRPQIKRKGKQLHIMLNRIETKMSNANELIQQVADLIKKEYKTTLPKEIFLYSRPIGTKDPDWRYRLVLDRSLRGIPSFLLTEDPPSEANTDVEQSSEGMPDKQAVVLANENPPNPLHSTQSEPDSFKLNEYCFTRNPLMLTLTLPDPELKVAQAIRFFHDLSTSDKKSCCLS